MTQPNPHQTPNQSEELARHIPLLHGMSAIVDADDYDRLINAPTKWMFTAGYVARNRHSSEPGPRRLIYMHKEILGEPGKHTDHINGNTLDNRRSNLRVCLPVENWRNQKKHKNNTTGFKGVYRAGKSSKFKAQIGGPNNRIYLGTFSTAEQASAAYEAKAKELYGQFARA